MITIPKKTFAGLVIFFTISAGACQGKVLASVGGEVVTTADVIAAAGYMPEDDALREAVETWIQREIVLSLAKKKALAASSDEVNRAAALAAKAHRTGGDVNATSFRGYLADEIVIAKYIDLYVFPRIKVDDKELLGYFLERPSLFIKKPPRDRAVLEKLFPRYRNQVLYRYVRAEIERLLRETGNATRAGLNVETYF